jgi:hypothetical protein
LTRSSSYVTEDVLRVSSRQTTHKKRRIYD